MTAAAFTKNHLRMEFGLTDGKKQIENVRGQDPGQCARNSQQLDPGRWGTRKIEQKKRYQKPKTTLLHIFTAGIFFGYDTHLAPQ